MSVCITQGSHGCGRDHGIVGTVEFLKEIGSLLPLLELCIAKSGIEIGQIASLGAAVLLSEIEEALERGAVAIESLLIVACCEIVLTLGDGCACLLLIGT